MPHNALTERHGLIKALTVEQRRIARELLAEMPRGHFKTVDVGVFCSYCSALSLTRRLRKAVEDEGATVASPRGGNVANPNYRALRFAQQDVHRYALALGLSPEGRARLQVQPSKEPQPGDSDPWDILSKPRGAA